MEILNLIEKEIESISKTNNYPGSSKSKSYRLTSIVSKHIESLHQAQMYTNLNMFDISRNKSILFSSIVEELEKDDEHLSIEEKAKTCRHYINISMRMRLMTCPIVNGTKVEDFLSEFLKLDEKSLIAFLIRIFPDINVNSDFADLNVRSIERADNLFNVINEVNDSLHSVTLDWNTTNGRRETPSTLGSNKYPEEFCSEIINNPNSADIRRDYNWIVGDVKYKIDDIDAKAGSITQPDKIGIDHDDITQPGKIGLLDINTKNNGGY